MRIELSDKTLEELDEAIGFYKEMEKDLNRDDATNYRHRHNNRKFNRDFIIREALKEFNKE